MVENARAELKQRGIKDAQNAPIPEDIFRPQAEQRVRMGLVVAELVKIKDLYAKPDQIKEHIERLASSYEKPQEVMQWYFGDKRNLAEVEAMVVEENVTQHVLSQVKVKEKELSFEELMGQ
jgi:trigger factor